jgi:hypothetical protein
MLSDPFSLQRLPSSSGAFQLSRLGGRGRNFRTGGGKVIRLEGRAGNEITPHRKARIAIYAEGRLIQCFDRISAMVLSVIRPCPATARFRFQKRTRGPKPVLPLLGGRPVCPAQRRLLGTFPVDFR